jgi:diacylglycerol O-acyltransferase-1
MCLGWLLGFTYLFHQMLNLTGELLRFGDREFYRDWWNCKNLADFWRMWNMPVHNFLVRHISQPLTKRVH